MSASPFEQDYDLLLETTMPEIAWREPVKIKVIGRWIGTRLGCRLCIARHGLAAEEVGQLPETQEQFDQHLYEKHPKIE